MAMEELRTTSVDDDGPMSPHLGYEAMRQLQRGPGSEGTQ